MESMAAYAFECSRCQTTIQQPTFVCLNAHLACDKCSKVFCQICRHLFEEKRNEIQTGKITVASSSKRIHPGNPYQPNDGTIEFGKNFLLPKKGQCRFYASIDHNQFTFNWKINPQEGTVEVDVSPRDVVKENWFILEFASPSDENKIWKKEWAVNHSLIINYHEVEAFYENDGVNCKIYVERIPYGSVVKPFENKIKDALVSVFKPKKDYERL